MNLWWLGYPEQALQQANEAISFARNVSHPFSLAYALAMAAQLHRLRREPRMALARVQEATAINSEHGFSAASSTINMTNRWARAIQGRAEGEIVQIQQTLEASQSAGVRMGVPGNLAFLARLYGQAGQVQEGLRALDEALTIVAQTKEGTDKAELYRIKGSLLLEQSSANASQAETCFRQALDIARSQQAKPWELRAAISLARLWQQDKRQDAYDLLAPVYNWFTEGFDTADLQEAKALLRELEG